MTRCNILLFDNFETLDACGPAEIFGRFSEEYCVEYFSWQGGIVTSAQNMQVETSKAENITGEDYLLLVPGGIGVRSLINEQMFLDMLAKIGGQAKWLLSVCTGSALLAKAGLLNGKKATSNKSVFAWVETTEPKVEWVKRARWVVDGNIYTSSGVTAGMDMSLGFIADRHGETVAQKVAREIEYTWHKDKDNDPFAI